MVIEGSFSKDSQGQRDDSKLSIQIKTKKLKRKSHNSEEEYSRSPRRTLLNRLRSSSSKKKKLL